MDTGCGPSACVSWPGCCPGYEPQGATGIPEHTCNSCSPTAVLLIQGHIQRGASWQQVQHPVGDNSWAPTWPQSRLGANAAESGLLTPFILIGNGNPSSALHSLGDGGLSQLLLQAPPAAGLQEGGWEEKGNCYQEHEGTTAPAPGLSPTMKPPQTCRADLCKCPCLVPAGQGGAGGQLRGQGATEVGSTHLPCDQRDIGNSLCCGNSRWELNMRTGTCQGTVTLTWSIYPGATTASRQGSCVEYALGGCWAAVSSYYLAAGLGSL